MKTILTNKHIVMPSLTTLLIVAVGGLWWVSNDTQANKYYPADLAQQGYFDIPTDNGVVTLGNKATDEQFEAEVNFVQDANSGMAISYNLGKEVAPVVENNLVKWKKGSQEVFFKQIPAGTSTSQSIPHAVDNGLFRYIPLGSTNLAEFVASYELFSSRQSTTPAITTFIPSQDGYVFYGKRTAETDLLNPEETPYPITRINVTNPNIICPVIPVTKGGLIAAFIYYPHIGDKKDQFTQAITDSLNQVLHQQGISTQIHQRADSLFYLDGIQPVMLGRIAGDEHHLGFFMYLDSPYHSPLKNHLRQRISLQDTILRPYGALKDLDSTISPDILDAIMQGFAQKAGYSLANSSLSESETAQLTNLQKHQHQDTWVLDAVRANDATVRNYDRFEFDILLHEQPNNNDFTYEIDTENLEFRKNEGPTDTEINSGLIANAEAIGSYAAINQTITPRAFIKAQEEYQSNTAFTIYRPKVIDATGEWQWAELEIDEERGELSVIVNREFLLSATYPVIVDPTFGNTNQASLVKGFVYGDGDENADNHMVFSYANASLAGYIQTMTIGITSEVPVPCKSAIYDGLTRMLMGTSQESYTQGGQINEIITMDFTTPVFILSQRYLLIARCEFTSSKNDGYLKSADGVSTSLGAYSGSATRDNYSSPWMSTMDIIDNFGNPNYGNYPMLIYATYTEEAGGAQQSTNSATIKGGTSIFGGTTIR